MSELRDKIGLGVQFAAVHRMTYLASQTPRRDGMIGTSSCDNTHIAKFGTPIVISQMPPQSPSGQRKRSWMGYLSSMVGNLVGTWGHAVMIVGCHKYELRQNDAKKIYHSTDVVPYTEPDEWQEWHSQENEYLYAVVGHTKLHHHEIDTICEDLFKGWKYKLVSSHCLDFAVLVAAAITNREAGEH
ncbi:hypothetical protein FRB94_003449 [Tulasnella sp. JGI-2019a]|nr:hypothetical protein FRB93_005313 [Tulasnella sp. JGI-2019a]KAG9002978.1 hypothetical protein FRB94_003449 [Tulasnella sp. JGI-2019a]KAG9032337.1 hypothetical protein FRB95_001590 [Tulasnella sp. JGI-2019a]